MNDNRHFVVERIRVQQQLSVLPNTSHPMLHFAGRSCMGIAHPV